MPYNHNVMYIYIYRYLNKTVTTGSHNIKNVAKCLVYGMRGKKRKIYLYIKKEKVFLIT